MAKFGRILVVRGGAIGDFILTLPVLGALRETYPNALVGCLAPAGLGDLALTAGLADKIQDLDGREWAEFFVSEGSLDFNMVKWLSQFDLVVSFLHDPDQVWAGNIKRICSGRLIQGCARPSDENNRPASITLLSALEEIGISEADPLPRIEMDAAKSDCFDLAVHLGSGSELKNWPIDKWCEFLDVWLLNNPGRVLVVGGEAETGKMSRIKQVIGPKQADFLENEPLPEVARGLKSSLIFIGHDSGMSHLATALGVPSIILWGSTNRSVWGPQHQHVRFIQSDGTMDSITPAEVLRAVREQLKS